MKVPIKKRYQSEDWLRRKFEDEDLLLCQIAELCEVSLTTISRWAARFEIREVRPYSGDRHGQNNPYWKTRALVILWFISPSIRRPTAKGICQNIA